MENLMSDIENEQLNQVAEPSDELEALLSGKKLFELCTPPPLKYEKVTRHYGISFHLF